MTFPTENEMRFKEKIKELEYSLNCQIEQNILLREQLESIQKSVCWKFTEPYRKVADFIKDGVFYSKIKYPVRRFVWLFRHGFYLPCYSFGLSSKEYRKQVNHVFNKNVTFSILVPLYNTPENFLREMIGSVLFQTYKNWELCLADGSDDEHSYVKSICEIAVEKDSRIKYKKLERNGGISENTNACLKMATGNYISLFDHDDLLHPSALYYNMKAICEENAEFIYTDEVIFRGKKLHNIKGTNFKPDFAPDYLNTCNYITHFSSFKKSLISDSDNFDSSCDGAQDYDIILKITEKTKKISHIKECLYYWRASPSSTASSSEAKTYTTVAGKTALVKHFARCGLEADVLITKYANRYKISYPIKNQPLVSILIYARTGLKPIQLCIDSIRKSSYANYEIIIIVNELFDDYNLFEKEPRIKFICYNQKNNLNYANIYNFGCKQTEGDYIIFLNSELEVKSKLWIEELLMFAQRNDVGAVGAKIYSPNNKILHAGYVCGIKNKGVVSSHYLHNKNSAGYAGRLFSVQDYSAVSMDCMMISKIVYDNFNGFDEKFGNSSDIDLCFRLRKAGYNIVWTPHAELCSNKTFMGSRKTDEIKILRNYWNEQLNSCDMYYNPNFNLKNANFTVANKIFHS